MEGAALTILDLIVIALYLVGMVSVGIWFARKSSNTEEFMAAGRSLPGWVVGLSIFGTYVSSISFIANPGKAYQANWNPLLFSLSIPLAALIAVKFFVPFYRSSSEISAYNHLETRFGAWARVYAVLCYLMTQLGRTGTILFLVAKVIFPLFDQQIPVVWIIVVTGILVTTYTLLGGIEAVIWTDAIQSAVLTLGILTTLGVLAWNLAGGPVAAVSEASHQGKLSLGTLDFSWTAETFWLTLIYGLFINLQNFGIDQSYVQRYATAKSEADARRSVWLGALLYVPISAALFLIGTLLWVFYRQQGGLPDGIKADDVYPLFIVQQLPPGITGILIAAILAAAMSSVDSSLNCSATLILCDVYKRFFRPLAGERESMVVLYAATLIFGLLGTLAACAMIGIKSALDVWWAIAAIASGGMLGLFLLGYLSRRANGSAALAGVVTGLVIIVWMSLCRASFWSFLNPGESGKGELPGILKPWECSLHANWTIVLSTTAIVLVGLMWTSVFSLPPASAKINGSPQ